MSTAVYQGPEPLRRSCVGEDADRELHRAVDRLFARRTRIAAAILIAANILFSLADRWLRAPAGESLVALKAVAFGLPILAYVLLRRPQVRPYAAVISWLLVAATTLLIALAGMAGIPFDANAILCVVAAITASALFPWGALVQLSLAAVAAVAIGLNLHWVPAAAHPAISIQGAGGLALCLICSVVGAVGVRSRLFSLIRDNIERRQAEEALRQSNQHLERRVGERATAIQAAKNDLTGQIAENRQLAETLRERQGLLRAIIDNSSALIYVKDLGGHYLLANAQHARTFGYPRSEIAGKTPFDLYPNDVAARIVANDREVLAADRPLQFEEVVPHADGQHTYLSVKFSLRAPGGTTYGTCGISTDITARTRLESALRHSRSTISAIIENSDEGIWALDQNYRILMLNSAARQRFPQAYGTQPEIGADFRELLPAEVRAVWDVPFKQALSGQRIVSETSVTVNGETEQFLVSLNPVIDATGVMGVTIFIKDITRLKRAEKHVRQHQAELAHVLRRSTMGELAAELAHEINQPLGAIANYAQGCRRRLDSGNVNLADLRYAIDQITAEIPRADGILARAQQTRLGAPASDGSIDVNRVVTDALRAVEFRCTELPLQLALAESLPPGDGDVIQIEQVVLNLLHNAIDAMQAVPLAARRLSVETRLTEPRTLEVAVRDTGQGLDPAVADKIFEPFVTTKADGLGMGLAISRSIVEAHRGRLWATCEPGHGCTFRFTLPVAATA